eukprot:1346762-Pyramimonas_sp.AAC.1
MFVGRRREQGDAGGGDVRRGCDLAADRAAPHGASHRPCQVLVLDLLVHRSNGPAAPPGPLRQDPVP